MSYLQRKNAKKPPKKGGLFFIMKPTPESSPQTTNNGELFGKRASKSTRKKSSVPNVDQEDPNDKILKEAFKLFDQDGNGTITIDEVRIALKTLGQDVSDEEVAELMGDVDEDGDDCIGFDEFKQMINKLEEAENQLYNTYIEDTFRVFDVDNDKLITPKDLKHTLSKLGLQCSHDEVCDTIRDSLKDVEGFRERAARQRMPALAEEGEKTIERRPVSRATNLPIIDDRELAILGVGMDELKIIAKGWPRPI